jgi:hypothetical protein
MPSNEAEAREPKKNAANARRRAALVVVKRIARYFPKIV